MKWKDFKGCYGIEKPWLFSVPTAKSATSNGKIRAWHYLADNAADKSLIFSIEKDDTVRALFYEFKDYTPPSTGTTWAATSAVKWAVKEHKVSTSFQGAEALAIGTAAILCLVMSTF